MYRAFNGCWRIHVVYPLAVLLVYCTPFVDIATAQTIQIPSGTAVTVRIDWDVTSKEAYLGEMVPASVVSDVVIDGETVIQAGASAQAVVDITNRASVVGFPGNVRVAILSITAVDGSQIPIMSTSKQVEGLSQVALALVVTLLFCCPLFLLIRGKNGVILAGTQVSGYTASTVSISV